jgi:lipopolysaccharide transport system ATP-binding protein
MYVRLAFAVAAHLESETLIVDEVLAVGDAEFQNKCLGKMDSISKGSGRTILFVSHNLNSIQRLCSKGILLENGGLKAIDDMNSIVDLYSNMSTNGPNSQQFENLNNINYKCKNGVEIKSIKIDNNIINQEQPLVFKIGIDSEFLINGIKVNLSIINRSDTCVLSAVSHYISDSNITIDTNSKCIKIYFNNHRLMPGDYKIKIWLKDLSGKFYNFESKSFFFKIKNDFLLIDPVASMGSLYSPSKFEIE